MAEQIEGDVAERDVLFELRCAGDPFAELLREDQGVVPEPQRVLGDVGGCCGGACAGELLTQSQLVDRDVPVQVTVEVCMDVVHRCGTPSDAV
ncbi:hypothetical protein GCM10009588_15170 [Microbacterium phyllosphaerae]